MKYRELFALVRQRPGMYGLDGSFAHFSIFVTGCDAGTSWSLLAGFREWLIVRVNDGDNLAWPFLVLWLAFPLGKNPNELDANDNAVAVDMLFRLLDEFLELREQHHGLAKIFTAYAAWLEDHRAKLCAKFSE